MAVQHAEPTGQGGPPASSSPSDKDRFDLLHDSLKYYHAGIIDFEFKHGSLLALGIGWLITSTNTQEFFAGSLLARLGGTAGTLLLTSFHAFWIAKYYSKSAGAHRKLTELAFMPQDYYEDQKIEPYLAITFIVVHAVFSMLICFLLWTV